VTRRSRPTCGFLFFLVKGLLWLDRAYQQRDPDLVYLKPTYFLTPLHDDPRWRALLKKMGLPPTSASDEPLASGSAR
jgi:hypothetical protein